jgi:histone-binding protein RBBP4
MASTTAGRSSAGTGSAVSDVADVLEERLIDAEYKIWKKNTPYLYDYVMTHSLEWPSLTCQWLPTVKNAGEHASEHSLLLGTHTTGEQNYLMVGTVNLPKNDSVVDNGTESKTTTPAAHYDEEKKELGGFGHANSGVGKIEIRMKVKHEGEVNRARYMPQNHFIVATRGPSPEVYIWDLSKHPSFPVDDTPFCPQGVCFGHSMEGYGLAWSNHNEGRLISGSEDRTINLWDVSSVTSSKSGTGTQIMAISVFRGHTDVVEDVDWHKRDPNMIGSVGDDKKLMIWDVREKNPNKAVHVVENAHDGDVNCIAFNPINEFVLATGSADKTVALWDMRNLKSYVCLVLPFCFRALYAHFVVRLSLVFCSRVQTLSGHNDQVYMVEWAPHNESILGSCSSDRRVAVWDLSRIGMEQTAEDAEDGPPELLFLHGGHTSKVNDFSWNPNDEWAIASVSEDNVLQIWNMAEEIYTPEEDDEAASHDDDELGDDDLEL